MTTHFAVLSSDLLSAAKGLDPLKTLIETNHKSLDERFPVDNQNKFVDPNLHLTADQAFVMMGSNRDLQRDLGPFEAVSVKAPLGADVLVSKLKKKNSVESPKTYVMIVSTTYKGTVIPGSVKNPVGDISGVPIKEVIDVLEQMRQKSQ